MCSNPWIGRFLWIGIACWSPFFLLGGCSFHPVLAPSPSPPVPSQGGGSSVTSPQTFHLTIQGEGEACYLFRRELEKNLSVIPYQEAAPYRLNIQLQGTEDPAAYASTGNVTRVYSTLTAVVRMTLPKGKEWSQTRERKGSYPIFLRDEFVSRMADVSIRNHAAIQLAQDIAFDVMCILKKYSAGPQQGPSRGRVHGKN